MTGKHQPTHPVTPNDMGDIHHSANQTVAPVINGDNAVVNSNTNNNSNNTVIVDQGYPSVTSNDVSTDPTPFVVLFVIVVALVVYKLWRMDWSGK